MEGESHLPDGAAPQGTQANGADDTSGGTPSSESTVHPGAKVPGDEEYFHKEGDQVWKTKEEYISHVNRQRGAASKIAANSKILEQQLADTNAKLAALQSSNPTPPSKEVQAAKAELDEESKKAIDVLREHAGFMTVEQFDAKLNEILSTRFAKLEELYAERSAGKAADNQRTLTAFVGANPEVAERMGELADLMDDLGLEKKYGAEAALAKAYTLLFDKPPKKPASADKASEAFNKGKVAALKQGQAGGGNGAAPGGKDPEDRDYFDRMRFS